MPPARKKGGPNSNNNNNVNNNSNNKVKSSVTEFQLGDLVLAKVKGFPPWPATVSRPEDWERTSDPKKYFVQFFGTQEIAFVAPPDIQAFTIESKSKLLARCKGKTVKYFAQAVKEICEAFEESQKHGDIRGPLSHASNVNDGKINGSYAESTKVLNSGESCYDVLERSLLRDSAMRDKQSASRKGAIVHRHENIKTKKESNSFPLVLVQALCTVPSLLPPIKEETISDEDKTDSTCREHSAGTKDPSMSLDTSGHLKVSAGEDKKSANRDKSKDIKVGIKRKVEGVICHASDAKAGGFYGDGTLGKVSGGGLAKRLASDLNKFEVNAQGKASKNLLKCSKLLDDAKSSPQNLVTNAEGVEGGHPRQMNGQSGNDQSLSVKKAKLSDRINDATKGSVLKNGKSDMEAEMLDEEAVPPVVKRRHHALDAGSISGKRSLGISSKNDVPKKRRAVRLCDDDDEPKTPVHGGYMKSDVIVSSSALISDSVQNNESSNCAGQNSNLVIQDGDGSQKDHPSANLVGESSLGASLPLKADSSIKANVSHSPGLKALDKRAAKESMVDSISPTKSPQAVAAVKIPVDQQTLNKPFTKVTNSVSHSKAQVVFNKDPTFASGGSNSSQSQVSAQKCRKPFFGERAKVPPKTSVKLTEQFASLDNHKERDSKFNGRLEDTRDKSGSLVDSKASDTSNSIKDLIAQAKRRQAHMINVPLGGGDSVSAPVSNLLGRSPSPSPSSQAFHSGGVNVTQLEAQRVESRGCFASPSVCAPRLGSEESEEKGLSLGHPSAGSTLSGGTEAAVARDAFEGMIETLSRTKESIGRATRLAIDCAKYGIANEVVDLLIRKLENESSFHRRVDLFFLVDSITQCSHGQKGVAGASYLPTVEAALPRLLGAAAPPGVNARENRRQCLKVLRLWLERKILPESVLRRFMDDIGGSNDAKSNEVSFKRPSRVQRSVDDPIRGMEGMLVDEYGSNATFNLPGFLTTHGFVDDEEDDDVPSTPHNQSEASPPHPCMNTSIWLETGRVTPNDKRHHILEDVDGELEMEDATGHPKVGALSPYDFSNKDERERQLDTEVDPSTNNIVESPTLNGSPPPPLKSPPPLPPLPSSPPPPPLPLSLPSPPPPPPPPPPSTLLSQPPMPSLLPSGPPQAGILQPSVPPQPLMIPQVVLHHPAATPSVQVGHAVKMAGNTSQHGLHFVPAGASISRPLEYRQTVMYPGQLAGPSNQQFQPSQATFVQRAFTPVSLPQPPLGPYAYNKPPVQQHMSRPHSHLPAFPLPPSIPYSASNQQGLRQFSDEQWRSAPAEYKADNHHNAWVNGGRAQSCPTTSFIGEAYFRPPERAPSDNSGHHTSAPNSALGGPSSSGSINHMLPSRPDMSSLNCWRPA